MKYLSFLFGTLMPLALSAQSHSLMVVNGYGDGFYMPGDTVHIWAAESPVTEIFRQWTGQVSFLSDSEEWHTTVIMPDQDVRIEAINKLLPPGAGYIEAHIMGRDTIKRVFYFFPPGGSAKGVVWLFHGTGGNARQFVEFFESRYFANRLMADSFAIITMESEETTKNFDTDTSGSIRWNYTVDSIKNVDIANVRAVRDTFIAHGLITPGMQQMAAGFSAGGSFSMLIAWILQWKAAVNHNTPGPGICAARSNVPTLFSMTYRDHHPEVGSEGNMEAYLNYQNFISRQVCSEFYLFRPIPLHPERFKRFPGISSLVSQGLFDELKTNNCLNAKNHLTLGPDEVALLAFNNPQSWPTAVSLNADQKTFVHDELQYIWSAHFFHSDFSGKDLRFLTDPCSTNTTDVDETNDPHTLLVYPNPASDRIYLPVENGMKYLYDHSGKLIMSTLDNEFDLSFLPQGLFLVKTKSSWGRLIHQ